MKKHIAALQAALLLLSLFSILALIAPASSSNPLSFFRHLPGLSAPACLIVALAAYAFYYLADQTGRKQP